MTTAADKNRNTIYVRKLATVVESNPKTPFLSAITPRGNGGRNSFLLIAPL